MKNRINLTNGKTIDLPARMFTLKEIEEMEIPFVEGKIFFNRAKKGSPFIIPSKEIFENMAILNYRDFSQENFSEKKLSDFIREQIELDSDFIIFPYFKNENEYDIKVKIEMAGKLKSGTSLNKKIIVEISHKSDLVHRELSRLANNFDILSIFYGVYYGRYSSLTRIVEKIVGFKARTGKEVLCNGIPYKFEGENVKDCRFMPCFSLIADIWVRNWKPARSSKDIKVIDREDLKSKSYEEWLDNHKPNQVIEPIKLTVRELFRPKNEAIRKAFEKFVYDETFSEVDNLSPSTIENYIYKKFPKKYFILMVYPYGEKIIQKLMKNNDLFGDYSSEELILLENKIRENQFSPSRIEGSIKIIEEKIRQEKTPPIKTLLKSIEEFNWA